MTESSASTRFTVLLANEQEGWHQTVRGLLEPQGVQTVSARSGREALNLIEREPVHVAVLDAQMPQLGGLQVVRRMRGGGARTLIEREPVHVAVLDAQMPQLGGLQVVRMMREVTKNAPPAILLAN